MGGTIDEINPVKAWDQASEENRFSDKSTWTAGEPQRSRILLETPLPEARIVIGYPTDTFGYPGLSMQARHYFFLDVAGRARLQFGMPVTWVAEQQWFQYARRDIVMGGGANALLSSTNRFLVSAGGAWTATAVAANGEMLPDGTWNSTDMNEILDAMHWGLRAFDERIGDVERDHKERLGYKVDPKPIVPAAAAGTMDKLLAVLGGKTPTPTKRSQKIARLLDLNQIALLDLLEKVGRVVNALTKLASKKESLPFVGPVFFEKVRLLKAANSSIRELMTAPQVATAGSRLGTWKGSNDYDAMMNWLALFGDLARRLTRLKNAAIDLLTTVAKFVGAMAPPPAVLGLVGRDGVSVVTHDDVFAWAPNGFRFIGSKNAEDYPVDPVTSMLRRARDLEKQAKAKLGALGDFVFGKDPPPKGSDASFRVMVDDDIELRSEGDTTITAWGDGGRLRAEASLAAEVAATNVLGLCARSGVVEVMGREVSIGIPNRSDAKKAAKERLSPSVEVEERILAELAAKRASTAREAAEAFAAVQAANEARSRALDAAMAAPPLSPARTSAFADATTATLALIRGETALVAKKAAAKLALEMATAADEQLRAARERAGTTISASRVASAMDWKATKQAVANTVSVHARDEVSVYCGKTLTIESGKSLELKAEDLMVPVDKAVIKVEKTIELEVGTFKVTIAKDKVTVNNGATDVLVIDASGAVLQTAAGAKVSATGANVALEAAADANITANGRVLLG